MKSSDDITPIDDLVAQLWRVPVGDHTEHAHLGAARRKLDRVLDGATPGRRALWPRSRRWRRSLASVPVIATGLVAALIAVSALTLLRPHPLTPHGSLSGPTATRAADALIAKLAVLRRPQTSADRLPGHLKIDQGAISPNTYLGTIIPSLSRLVASPPGARLYLVVTRPVGGSRALWSARLGDQVTILALTAHGATETPGYPAVELADAGMLIRAPINFGGAPRRVVPRDAYDVAIVPDGVARVRWTFANRDGGPGRTITARVANNVAFAHLTAGTVFLWHATWYAADGSVIPTTNAALTAAISARNNAERRQALRQVERQHVSAPTALLDAFAVFSFNAPGGTRTSSGYIISRPPLSQLPLSVLQLSSHRGADLRQARHVIAPSGRDMWVIPGPSGLCVWATDRAPGPYGQRLGGGAGGCSSSVAQATAEGTGFSSTSTRTNGSVIYGVVPKATHSVTIQTGAHTHRTIHPVDGVYITTTPFMFG